MDVKNIQSRVKNIIGKHALNIALVFNTIFTWLNNWATISYVLKLDAATIQGWCLLH